MSAANIATVAYPLLDLKAQRNPIPTLLASFEYLDLCRYFETTPGSDRSLIPTKAQAIIYALVRNLDPEHVVEIGTFKGGTAEGICRALAANGRGTLHTIGPFDSEHFLPFLETWPDDLKSRLKFYPTDSMCFFMEISRRDVRPALVFVDGNHDYEYALFDIQCAANYLLSGGFIVVDNVSQSGPYYAIRDFMRANPTWSECRGREPTFDPTKAFDRERHAVPGCDFMILRAPEHYTLPHRPKTFGEVQLKSPNVSSLTLSVVGEPKGQLHVQCVLRGFSSTEQVEKIADASHAFNGQGGEVEVVFDPPLRLERRFNSYRAEPWLTWTGPGEIDLLTLPIVRSGAV